MARAIARRGGSGHIRCEMGGQELALYDPAKLAEDRRTVRRGFWRKLRRAAARVPFLDDLLAAYWCALDPATPKHVKAVLLGALAYFVLPADMIPDFVVHLGFTDDATVLMAAVGAVKGHIGERHRDKAKKTLARIAG